MDKAAILKIMENFEGQVMIDTNFTVFKVVKILSTPDYYKDELVTVKRYKYWPWAHKKCLNKVLTFGKVNILYKRNYNANSETAELIECSTLKELQEWYVTLKESWVRLELIKSDLVTFGIATS